MIDAVRIAVLGATVDRLSWPGCEPRWVRARDSSQQVRATHRVRCTWPGGVGFVYGGVEFSVSDKRSRGLRVRYTGAASDTRSAKLAA
jgi:hypothetical protein